MRGMSIGVMFRASWKHGWIGDMSMEGERENKTEYQIEKEREVKLNYDEEFAKFQDNVTKVEFRPPPSSLVGEAGIGGA